MILHLTRGYGPPFQVLDYTAQVYDTNVDSASRVMSKMERRDSGGVASSSSTSPLSKEDPAPPLAVPSSLACATIKVRILNDPNPRNDGLPYLDRLEVSKGNTMLSIKRNIISASLNALVDGFEYALRETVAACGDQRGGRRRRRGIPAAYPYPRIDNIQ